MSEYNKDYSKLDLEQLNDEIMKAQSHKDEAVKFLRMLMKHRDTLLANKHVSDIVDSLSEDQKLAMYSQIVGVKAAISGAKSDVAKGSK